jgi:hypothetical protein
MVEDSSHIRNNKQSKVQLRDEGVNPTLIGTKVLKGKGNQLVWLAPGKEVYKPFEEKDWALLTEGGARL